MNIKCPNCGKRYDAEKECNIRIREGVQATIRCLDCGTYFDAHFTVRRSGRLFWVKKRLGVDTVRREAN